MPCLYGVLNCNLSVCFISFAVFSRESRQGLPLQLSVSLEFVLIMQHKVVKQEAKNHFRMIHDFLCNLDILFSSIRVNVGCGPAEERVLLTGLHAVADIYCENCKTTLGWKYVSSGSHTRYETTYLRQTLTIVHTGHAHLHIEITHLVSREDSC